MQPLARLWLLKQRAVIRNLFKKWSSGIFTVLMVLLYGGIFISFLSNPSQMSMVPSIDLDFAILLSLGFASVLVFTTLFQKRKALFYEQDSFYLFSGPFKRSQVMGYLMAQTFLGSFLYSLISIFMMSSFIGKIGFEPIFILITFICYLVMFMFWLNFTDYLYILSITNKKFKVVSYYIAGLLIAIVAGIYLVTLIQINFDISNSLVGFAQNRLFYFVPIFGWIKLILISYISSNYLMLFLGFALLFGAYGILTYFFLSYKGDFYEQAMLDSIELSGYVKEMRAGKKSSMGMNDKVKEAHVKFRNGAAAIFSKNILLMKKTNSFIRKQDILILVFYFIIALVSSSDNGFFMFCYLLSIWLFILIQDSDMLRELKNYQIYLIPDSPFKKLWYVISPTLIKLVLMVGVAITGAGLYFKMPIFEIVQYLFMLWGYVFVFISASVLSVRLFKSRSNVMMENMFRILIIILAVIPSAIVLFVSIQSNLFGLDSIMLQSTIISLIMNFIISFAILMACKNMMNGREINSD